MISRCRSTGVRSSSKASAPVLERMRAWSLVARELYGPDCDRLETLAQCAVWPEGLLRESYRRGLAACAVHPDLPAHECAMLRVQQLVLGAPGIDADLALARSRELARPEGGGTRRAVPVLLAAASAAAGAIGQPHLAAALAVGSVVAGIRRGPNPE